MLFYMRSRKYSNARKYTNKRKQRRVKRRRLSSRKRRVSISQNKKSTKRSYKKKIGGGPRSEKLNIVNIWNSLKENQTYKSNIEKLIIGKLIARELLNEKPNITMYPMNKEDLLNKTSPIVINNVSVKVGYSDSVIIYSLKSENTSMNCTSKIGHGHGVFNTKYLLFHTVKFKKEEEEEEEEVIIITLSYYNNFEKISHMLLLDGKSSIKTKNAKGYRYYIVNYFFMNPNSKKDECFNVNRDSRPFHKALEVPTLFTGRRSGTDTTYPNFFIRSTWATDGKLSGRGTAALTRFLDNKNILINKLNKLKTQTIVRDSERASRQTIERRKMIMKKEEARLAAARLSTPTTAATQSQAAAPEAKSPTEAATAQPPAPVAQPQTAVAASQEVPPATAAKSPTQSQEVPVTAAKSAPEAAKSPTEAVAPATAKSPTPVAQSQEAASQEAASQLEAQSPVAATAATTTAAQPVAPTAVNDDLSELIAGLRKEFGLLSDKIDIALKQKVSSSE